MSSCDLNFNFRPVFKVSVKTPFILGVVVRPKKRLFILNSLVPAESLTIEYSSSTCSLVQTLKTEHQIQAPHKLCSFFKSSARKKSLWTFSRTIPSDESKREGTVHTVSDQCV